MNEQVIDELVRRMNEQMEKIIRSAFEKHFGFPLSEVLGGDGLERWTYVNFPIVEFLYKGQVFLIVENPGDFTVERVSNAYEARIEIKYREV